VTLADGSYINPDGAKTTAPRVIRSVEASFSNEARMARVQGVCLVSLIVDPHGMPQQLHLARSLTPSMDQKAFEAIEQYRFQPAMKNGVPVPVVITIEVDFRLY
jgi:TonB family protein